MEENSMQDRLEELSKESSDLCHEAFLLAGRCMADFAWWSESGHKDNSYLEDAEQGILLAQSYLKKALENALAIRREQPNLQEKQ